MNVCYLSTKFYGVTTDNTLILIPNFKFHNIVNTNYLRFVNYVMSPQKKKNIKNEHKVYKSSHMYILLTSSAAP
jgi:hypothetical protein